MTYQNILSSVDAGIQTITINRPSKLNALNKATIQELNLVLQDAESSTEVRAIILTGAGE